MTLPLIAQSLEFTCGAACFASMMAHLRPELQKAEMQFAEELGTLLLGYTPPSHIVQLAAHYGLESFLKEGAHISEIAQRLQDGHVVFVTWWDEDAGHYSLVQSLDSKNVVLMDPWSARKNEVNILETKEFLKNWSLRGRKMICARAPARPHP